jgi:mono/diheme cytochrome c family protein
MVTSATPIPPGTAPRGTAEYLGAVAPPGPPLTRAVLARGREGYQVYCVPCHGVSGHGDGVVTLSGFASPSSFQDERVATLAPAEIVAVIGDGKGRMLPMGERIPPAERWSIAYFVKALQLAGGAAATPGGAAVP